MPPYVVPNVDFSAVVQGLTSYYEAAFAREHAARAVGSTQMSVAARGYERKAAANRVVPQEDLDRLRSNAHALLQPLDGTSLRGPDQTLLTLERLATSAAARTSKPLGQALHESSSAVRARIIEEVGRLAPLGEEATLRSAMLASFVEEGAFQERRGDTPSSPPPTLFFPPEPADIGPPVPPQVIAAAPPPAPPISAIPPEEHPVDSGALVRANALAESLAPRREAASTRAAAARRRAPRPSEADRLNDISFTAAKAGRDVTREILSQVSPASGTIAASDHGLPSYRPVNAELPGGRPRRGRDT